MTINFNSLMQEIKRRKEKEAYREELLSLIEAAKKRLNTNHRCFNEVTDEDLTEFCIYERRAAELEYMHLLRLYSEAKFDSEAVNKPLFFKSIFKKGDLNAEAMQ